MAKKLQAKTSPAAAASSGSAKSKVKAEHAEKEKARKRLLGQLGYSSYSNTPPADHKDLMEFKKQKQEAWQCLVY